MDAHGTRPGPDTPAGGAGVPAEDLDSIDVVGQHILVVEDDDGIALPLVRTLTREGYDVQRVAQGSTAVDRILEKERALGAGIKFDDIVDEVAGVYPKIMKDGALDAGAWSCGLVVGLIKDIPTVKELVDRIVQEATEIISGRLARIVG